MKMKRTNSLPAIMQASSHGSDRPKKRHRHSSPGMNFNGTLSSSLSLLASVASVSCLPPSRTTSPSAASTTREPTNQSLQACAVIRRVSNNSEVSAPPFSFKPTLSTGSPSIGSKRSSLSAQGLSHNFGEVSVPPSLKATPPSTSAIATTSSKRSTGNAQGVAVQGVSLFLREMKGSNPKDMANAMNTLALCLRTEIGMGRNDYAATLFAVNGYKCILGAMRKWGKHEALQEAGCDCLSLITDHEDKAVTSTTTLVAMEAATVAMRGFPQSYSIQRSAMATLEHCCDRFCDASPSNIKVCLKTYRKFLELQGRGVQLATHAMRLYPTNLDLQVLGSSLIHTLSTQKDCWQALKDHHAMSAVSMAYENHGYSEDIKLHLQNLMDVMLR